MRKCFYSFHFEPDSWRASQIRNMGVVEGNQTVSDNDWETVKKGGDDGIKRWIDNQLVGKDCTIVLIGAETAGRKWIKHEIEKSWNQKKGILGVHIHNLKNSKGIQSPKGANPFSEYNLNGTPLTDIIRIYDPPYFSSSDVYEYISINLKSWVETAISIRARH